VAAAFVFTHHITGCPRQLLYNGQFLEVIMQQVVGLIGLKGSGKDTAATFLRARGFVRVAFADALYQEVAETYGVQLDLLQSRDTKETPLEALALKHCRDSRFIAVCRRLDPYGTNAEFLEKWRSPRQILQWWGTDYRRKIDKDSYWLDLIRGIIDAYPETNFVITDVRFPNEADFVSTMGGKLARIRRPSLEALAALERESSGTFAHPSETALLTWQTDYEFINEDGNPDRLQDEVLEVFSGHVAAI
jgi:hypothetical protein